MNLKWASLAALGLMIAGLAVLYPRHELFAHSVVGILVQVLAAGLMIAARITFGMRSFHATANTTEGGLVTSGPYRWLRHPIYSAILYFIWAAAIDYHTPSALGAAILVTLGALGRIYAEERFLGQAYPEYAAYSARTARVIPFVL